MKKIKIMVVDDESVVREGIVTILSLQSELQVVGDCSNGEEAIYLAKEKKPEIVLLDLSMPKRDGLSTIPILMEALPKTKIIILTSFAESDKIYQAIKLGAVGFLLKDTTRKQLLEAIQDVYAGKGVIHPSIAIKVINEINHPSEFFYTSSPLTLRELETLKLIARGLNNQEIASIMVVHERTVAKHVSSILEKLQVANRTQAALYAIREGLSDGTSFSSKKKMKRKTQ